MVDFAALKNRTKAQMEEAKNKPIPPTELERVSHIISYHLTELTDWEEGFIYNQKTWLTKAPGNYLGEKPAKILKELEDKYCGSMCHAMNKAGVKHG